MLARVMRGHTYRTRAIGRMELADKTQLADFKAYLIGRRNASTRRAVRREVSLHARRGSARILSSIIRVEHRTRLVHTIS